MTRKDYLQGKAYFQKKNYPRLTLKMSTAGQAAGKRLDQCMTETQRSKGSKHRLAVFSQFSLEFNYFDSLSRGKQAFLQLAQNGKERILICFRGSNKLIIFYPAPICHYRSKKI